MSARISVLCAALTVLASVAYAWNSDSKSNLRCSDGSFATTAQQSGGNWTVAKAGNNGKTGGSFLIEGKAALAACGEGWGRR